MNTKHYKNYNYIYIADFVNGETAFVLKIEEYKLFKNQVAVECGKFASIPSFSIITVFQKNPQGWGGREADVQPPSPHRRHRCGPGRSGGSYISNSKKT